jgi:hypothetical protein
MLRPIQTLIPRLTETVMPTTSSMQSLKLTMTKIQRLNMKVIQTSTMTLTTTVKLMQMLTKTRTRALKTKQTPMHSMRSS